MFKKIDMNKVESYSISSTRFQGRSSIDLPRARGESKTVADAHSMSGNTDRAVSLSIKMHKIDSEN